MWSPRWLCGLGLDRPHGEVVVRTQDDSGQRPAEMGRGSEAGGADAPRGEPGMLAAQQTAELGSFLCSGDPGELLTAAEQRTETIGAARPETHMSIWPQRRGSVSRGAGWGGRGKAKPRPGVWPREPAQWLCRTTEGQPAPQFPPSPSLADPSCSHISLNCTTVFLVSKFPGTKLE